MSQLVIVKPNETRDELYSFHAHTPDCDQRKSARYKGDKDAWSHPLPIDSVQALIETAFEKDIENGEWPDFEDQLLVHECVPELPYDRPDEDQEVPAEAPEKAAVVVKAAKVTPAAPKPAAAPVVRVLPSERRYAISGVFTLDQLAALTGVDRPLVFKKLEEVGVGVRESNQKVYVPKKAPGTFKNVHNVNRDLAVTGNPADEVKIILTGTVATLLNRTEGVSTPRGRGTRYTELVSKETALSLALQASVLAQGIIALKTRTAQELANLYALDKAIEDLADLL